MRRVHLLRGLHHLNLLGMVGRHDWRSWVLRLLRGYHRVFGLLLHLLGVGLQMLGLLLELLKLMVVLLLVHHLLHLLHLLKVLRDHLGFGCAHFLDLFGDFLNNSEDLGCIKPIASKT